MSAERDRQLAQSLLDIVNRSGPQVRQEGQRLIIEQNGQTISVELNNTVQQASSTARYR